MRMGVKGMCWDIKDGGDGVYWHMYLENGE